MRYEFDKFGWYTGTINGESRYSTEVAPPDEVPEGQRPNWTGHEWVLMDYVAPELPPRAAPDYGKVITQLAFRSRWTKAEKVGVEQAADASVDVRVALKDQEAASAINLQDPRTRNGVIDMTAMLEQMGVIPQGEAGTRAVEILDAPVSWHELPESVQAQFRILGVAPAEG